MRACNYVTKTQIMKGYSHIGIALCSSKRNDKCVSIFVQVQSILGKLGWTCLGNWILILLPLSCCLCHKYKEYLHSDVCSCHTNICRKWQLCSTEKRESKMPSYISIPQNIFAVDACMVWFMETLSIMNEPFTSSSFNQPHLPQSFWSTLYHRIFRINLLLGFLHRTIEPYEVVPADEVVHTLRRPSSPEHFIPPANRNNTLIRIPSSSTWPSDPPDLPPRRNNLQAITNNNTLSLCEDGWSPRDQQEFIMMHNNVQS